MPVPKVDIRHLAAGDAVASVSLGDGLSPIPAWLDSPSHASGRPVRGLGAVASGPRFHLGAAESSRNRLSPSRVRRRCVESTHIDPELGERSTAMSGNIDTTQLLTFDPSWYAETAAGFAVRSGRGTEATTIGAGVAMIGPHFQESTRGSMVPIEVAERMARDWWGSDYPSRNPEWRDRVAGLMIAELSAEQPPDGWYDVGYYTVVTSRAEGATMRSEGWLRTLGGDIYSWISQGPSVSWLPLSGANLTQSQALVIDELFPPGLTF